MIRFAILDETPAVQVGCQERRGGPCPFGCARSCAADDQDQMEAQMERKARADERREKARADEAEQRKVRRKAIKAGGQDPAMNRAMTEEVTIKNRYGNREVVKVVNGSPLQMSLGRNPTLKAHHKPAVERYLKDREATSSLRAASFEMAVDGSGQFASMSHLQVVEAQTRIRGAQGYVGRDWPLVEMVVIQGLSPNQIAQAAQIQRLVVAGRVAAALDALAEFYTPGRAKPDRLLRFAAYIVQQAAQKTP